MFASNSRYWFLLNWSSGARLGAVAILLTALAPLGAQESELPPPTPADQDAAEVEVTIDGDPTQDGPQDEADDKAGAKKRRRIVVRATGRPQPSHWIGVACDDLPDALKAHLQVEGGLLVEHVMDDSPAAKAGLKKHDILISFAGQKLRSLDDLVKAVADNKDEQADLELIRGGKEQSIKITPAKRPPRLIKDGAGGRVDVDVDSLIDELSKLRGRDGRPGRRGRMFWMRPGVILPRNFDLKIKTLPKDVSVTIKRQGDEPAQITVKKGDKTWDITSEELDKLPDSIRPHVQRMLRGDGVGIELDFDGWFRSRRGDKDEDKADEGEDDEGASPSDAGKGEQKGSRPRVRIHRFPRFEFRGFSGDPEEIRERVEKQVREALRRSEARRKDSPGPSPAAEREILNELRKELDKQREELEKLRKRLQEKANPKKEGETA